ncbi:tellurite resistance/C4-dicarboxylate transporter family protein [Streptomyces antibioticus]|uniref:tellurite resistance/C4-dicarboxylate transporter family protein n=1 Tax=Streptomyces antibioticus TaxID=1890 RepID=UPI0022589A25|nr:tellurite resistance/C4-dicarboxylate transporter family protein [Streptomyces antibioticus]MCX5171015.1 tellurite resistance/C4-dicarboxylate transporter family protein [Streptomyces antibioticus]
MPGSPSSAPSSGPSGPALRAWWAERPPAAGAAVMATGILSIALHLAGHEGLSRVMLALAGIGWVGLAADFVLRLVRERERWLSEASTPGGLTAVAATTVLGTRLSTLGWPVPAEALLAVATVLWPVLLLRVMRHWTRRMPGAVFLCCVATEGLAVLAATLAAEELTEWLAHAALVLFWLGLVLYVLMLARFDPRQVTEGAGDQWVAGGALAISALAGTKLIAADSAEMYLWNVDDEHVLRTVTIALLVLALGWYAVLLVAEIVRPRPRFDVRRWATVFPMGMTAAALLSAVPALGIDWPQRLGEVLLWVAVAVWLAVAVAAAVAARTTIGAARPR